MGKKILIVVIIVQAIVIVLAGYNLWQKKHVLGTSVSPIKKGDIVFSPTDEYKYFYEPKANSLFKSDIPLLESTNTINADSLNERYDYSVTKPDKTYRIITLGDSFTYGLYVDTKDNWSEVLEDKLNSEMKCSNINKFEVINLGVEGYDEAYSVERFKKRGQKYSPDLVLWYIVDVLRVSEEMRKMFAGYIDYVKNDKTIDATTAAQMERELFGSSRETTILKYGENSILDYQAKAIKELKQYFSGPITLISLPNWAGRYKDFLQKQAKDNGYYYFGDSRNYYNMDGYFVGDLHPNKKGHQIIAEDMFNYLKNNKIIPCN